MFAGGMERFGFFGRKIEDVLQQQTGSGIFSSSADDVYRAIRSSSVDIVAIAKNTGIKISNIEKVKNHIFYQEHLLDRYVEHGIPAEVRQFDSDLSIANAWRRLETGNYGLDEIQLLRHEIAEAWYMRKYGPGYTAAHNAAQARYPAPDLTNKKTLLGDMHLN